MPSVPPKLRKDLAVSQQLTAEGKFFVVKDPVTGDFFRFGESERFIAEQFDGASGRSHPAEDGGKVWRGSDSGNAGPVHHESGKGWTAGERGHPAKAAHGARTAANSDPVAGTSRTRVSGFAASYIRPSPTFQKEEKRVG
jgi:hypothetical protein